MSTSNPSSGCSSGTKKTPLVLDGVAREDVTTEFLREIHQAADAEGIPLENISVDTR